MGRFDDKVAVVTGAGSGIGLATAAMFCSEGAKVLAVDLRFGPDRPPYPEASYSTTRADVSDVDAPSAVVTRATQLFGGLDILVNAAGILRIAPLLEVTRESWSSVIAVNLTSVFFLSQAAARQMIDAGTKGRIVNVSSVHAVVSEPGAAPYTASKGGLEAMTRTMASELAPYGITANCVRPGATWTAMSRPLYTPEVLQALRQRVPLAEIAEPEWIASAICYLASDQARYSTGAALDVDGGYAMNGALPGRTYDDHVEQ
jgi:NAD(P)-dependent dehydrogenase (short-subunit alcohol dehydrogenase family)